MNAAPRPPIRLRLSDAACAERVDGVAPPAVALAPRDAALLAWLALEGPTPRERLAHLLWPDSTEQRARTNLRQRLFHLHKLLGCEVAAGNPVLQLVDGVVHDLAGTVELLGDLALADAPGFEIWLNDKRSERRACQLDELRERARQFEATADAASALPLARTLLQLDPLSEATHQRIIRLHYLLGDRAAALQAFDACERMLKDELGARPGPATLALLQTIETSRIGAPAPDRRLPPATVLRPPRLVGREAELSALQRAWAAAKCVGVVGEAGAGKSRLLADFVGVQRGVVVSSARPGDAGVPFSTLARLLREVGRLHRVDALAPTELGQLARVLPELQPAGNGFVQAQRLQLHGAVTHFLGAAPGLVGVVLDDLHFADAASLEMLQSLIIQAPPGVPLWALAWRPVESDGTLAALQQGLSEAADLVRIELAPLGLAALAELVDQLDLGIAGQQLAPQLLQRTGGNPLYVLETLKQAWQEVGIGPLARGALLPRPASVLQLIGQRVARLSPQALRLARCAAVAGQDFSIGLAARVLAVQPIDLSDAWTELTDAQVLRGAGFAHDLIFDAVLASVPAPLAQHLHAQVAGLLEADGAEPGRIAWHWQQAQAWPAAGRALLNAAERAGLAGRRLERAALLADAAACFDHSSDAAARFEALQARADTLAAHDFADAALQAIADAEAAAQTPLQRLRTLAARVELGQMRADVTATLSVAPQALALARELGQPDMILRCTMPLCGALCLSGRATEAVERLQALRSWIDAEADPEQRRRYWNSTALSLDFAYRYADAVRAWQKTRDLAQALGPDHVSQAIGNLAWTQFKMGRIDLAAETGMHGLQLMRSGSDAAPLDRAIRQAGVAGFLLHIGRYAETLALFEDALPALRAGAAATLTAIGEHGMAQLFIQLGQPTRARALLADDIGAMAPHVRAMRLALHAALAQSLGGEALTPMREALSLLPDADHIALRVAQLHASAIVDPDEGEALATGLAGWASLRTRTGLALAAHVRAAACALAQGAATRALPHVESALDMNRLHQPEQLYRAEVWKVAAQVYAALNRQEDHARVTREGAGWVGDAARLRVPPAFVESFLHRNATNAALIEAAARLAPQ